MYLEHFNFKINPFTLKTDPHFLWFGNNQRQAMATLAYGLQENRGLVVLGGEFGTGKTTLVNYFVNTLKGDVHVTLLPEPGNGSEELRQAIANGFGIQGKPASQEDLTTALRRLAADHEGRKRRLLLIIDEAQRLTVDMLEDVLGLAQISHKGFRLIHILLVGQNEVYQWLSGTTQAAFINEVSATCNLHPLSAQETAAYIDHRLKTAGAARTPFAEDAIHTIHTVSRGIPRTINLACDFTLLQAHLRGFDQVDSELVLSFTGRFQIANIADTMVSTVPVREFAPLPATPAALPPPKPRPSRRLWAPLFLALCIAGGYWYDDAYRLNPIPRKAQAPAPGLAPEPAPPPPQREIQSALTPEPARMEAPQPTPTRLPVDGPPEVKGRSQEQNPPEPTANVMESQSAAAPGVTAAPPESPDTPLAPPPANSAPANPSASVEPRMPSPKPAVGDVDIPSAPPASGEDTQNAPDPAELIDWLMQQKRLEKPSPPSGAIPP